MGAILKKCPEPSSPETSPVESALSRLMQGKIETRFRSHALVTGGCECRSLSAWLTASYACPASLDNIDGSMPSLARARFHFLS
jgi:hypothetical protein